MARGLGAEGFVVQVATNGIDGLWLAREEPFGERDEADALDL